MLAAKIVTAQRNEDHRGQRIYGVFIQDEVTQIALMSWRRLLEHGDGAAVSQIEELKLPTGTPKALKSVRGQRHQRVAGVSPDLGPRVAAALDERHAVGIVEPQLPRQTRVDGIEAVQLQHRRPCLLILMMLLIS